MNNVWLRYFRSGDIPFKNNQTEIDLQKGSLMFGAPSLKVGIKGHSSNSTSIYTNNTDMQQKDSVLTYALDKFLSFTWKKKKKKKVQQ